MSTVIKPPPPPQPTTTKFAPVNDRVLLEEVLRINRNMQADMGLLRADMDLLIGQGESAAQWRGEVEEWRAKVDVAISRNSVRAREPSQHDLETKAQLAQERAAREALAQQVQTIDQKQDAQTKMIGEVRNAVVGTTSAIGKFFAHPKVRFVGRVIWLAALGYAAAKGIKVLP